jgi:hypothetical protein
MVGIIFPIASHGEESQKKETVRFGIGLYYTIQKGDTLWDISKRFYDSPYVWPDLWQKNDYIPNPHWIYPGNRIRLYDKTGIEVLPPPRLEIPKKEKQRRFITYDYIDRVGFIRRDAIRALGEIFSSTKHKDLLSTGDTVYIHSDDPGKFMVGDKFTVFKTYAPLRHPLREELVGVQHLFLGIVAITEVLPHMVVGNIVRSYREIHPGDFLMPYEEQSPNIELVESVPDLEGIIISADEQDRESILCTGMVAFIDKGTDDKIKSGQLYDIYIQEKATFYEDDDKRHVLPPPVVIGEILILRTENTTATALITKSSRDIRIGEKIHTPLLSSDTTIP